MRLIFCYVLRKSLLNLTGKMDEKQKRLRPMVNATGAKREDLTGAAVE